MDKQNHHHKHKALKALFEPTLSKAELTQGRIIEAAIKSYVLVGIEKSNYQQIAMVGSVSRSLIQHYFPDPDELLAMSVRFMISSFRAFAIEAIQAQSDSQEKLVAYIRSAFDWGRTYKNLEKFWFLFYYYCSIKKKYRDLNTEIMKSGYDHLTSLLTAGKEAGLFTCKTPAETARQIQVILTGALVVLGTQNFGIDSDEYVQNIIHLCLRLAGSADPR